MEPPAPVDPTKIPALSGVFAPVHEEHDVRDLTVHGEIPGYLRGAYLRNGPNPLFPPLGSYTFPLETLRSDWLVLDASDIAAGPVATVELPFRVPGRVARQLVRVVGATPVVVRPPRR